MKNKHFVFSLLGLFFITAIFALSLSVGEVQGNNKAIFDKGSGESCCVCFSKSCCINVAGSHCDSEGNLINGPLLEAFLALFGVDLGNVCSLCDACAQNEFSDSEDSQFIDICDLCIFEEEKIIELECHPGDGDGDGDGNEISGGAACSLRIRS